MGGKWRKKNRQHEVDKQSQHYRKNDHHAEQQNTKRMFHDNKLGSHIVSGPGMHPYSREKKHHQSTKSNNRQNQIPAQNRVEKAFQPSDHTSHKSILRQNRSIKQYLLNTMHETRNQIERWCPGSVDSSSEDEMDWIPEREIVIPQPGGPMMYEFAPTKNEESPSHFQPRSTSDENASKWRDVVPGERDESPQTYGGRGSRDAKGEYQISACTQMPTRTTGEFLPRVSGLDSAWTESKDADIQCAIPEPPFSPTRPDVRIVDSPLCSKQIKPSGFIGMEDEDYLDED